MKNISLRACIPSVVFCILLVIEPTFGAPTTLSTPTATVKTPTAETKRHKVKTADDAFEYLVKFGYINVEGQNAKEISNYIDLNGEIKKLQKFAKLPTTGKLDEATLKLMNSPRCHLPDSSSPQQHGKSKRYFAITRWIKNKLTYNILNAPSSSYDLQDAKKVSQAIGTSFNDWSSVANVDFQKSNDDDADIRVGFFKGKHGDRLPFDGLGGVLGHGFYPEAGLLHFDDDEKWSNIGYGHNLRQVATHEIGHIIGLGHSSVFGSVMFPYYSYSSNFKLTSDDVAGIVSLYGARPRPILTPTDKTITTPSFTTTTTTSTTTTTTTTQPTTTTPQTTTTTSTTTTKPLNTTTTGPLLLKIWGNIPK